MPVLSQFYGILIKMYFQKMEHNPPHFHAFYGEYEAEYNIISGRRLEGRLPRRADKLVRLWMDLHRQELLEIWETQKFKKIEPLE